MVAVHRPLAFTVIKKGWGERHPLSGSHFLPKEFVLLYAPRDDDELAMISRCLYWIHGKCSSGETI